MVEIIRGKIFRMAPAPTSKHQHVSGNLFFLIKKYLVKKRCNCFTAPFDVILPSIGKDFNASDKVVQPDLVVICDPSKIQEKGCFGAPDWIIEILSPFTAKKDLQIKFDLYEEAGVKEYWIVEPINESVEVFVLENGRYKRIKAYAQDDKVPCHTLLGLEIDLTEIFTGPFN
jgi:Uma2 family endonuclease